MSPDISINPQVRSAIRSFWHNVPAGLARVKNAIAEGWCKQPTGLFVQTLKSGVCEDKEVVVVAKEYPRPTLLQLNQLEEMGELVYTKLNEPGYSEVVAVNTGDGVLPWWVVLAHILHLKEKEDYFYKTEPYSFEIKGKGSASVESITGKVDRDNGSYSEENWKN